VLGRELLKFPGGKGANQAVGLARLGAAVVHLGKVGRDEHAGLLRHSLAAAGVETAGLLEDPTAPTGLALIQVAQDGANAIVVLPGANQAFTPRDLAGQAAWLAEAGFLVLQNEIPLETNLAAIALARRAGAEIVYNPAPFRPGTAELAAQVDYLILNEIELAELTGSPLVGQTAQAAALAEILGRWPLRAAVVTLGAAGALLGLPGRPARPFPALPVRALDTTAAGDAFVAGFTRALAEGQDPAGAVPLATQAAAYAVRLLGAQSSLPTRRQLADFLAELIPAQEQIRIK
jgi:ribokinase